MNDIGIIASIIAAITGIVAMITGIITIRNSKGNVTKRIEKRQQEIHNIEQDFIRTHGLNDDIRRYSKYWVRIDKLNQEIEELIKLI